MVLGFKKKVERIKVPLKQTNIGELTIRLMRGKDRLQADNPYLDALGNKKAFFVMCPTNATVKSLRERLAGLCHTPARLLFLHFKGKTLSDDKNVPSEAFEYITKEDSDDEIFKPRAKGFFHTSNNRTEEKKWKPHGRRNSDYHSKVNISLI